MSDERLRIDDLRAVLARFPDGSTVDVRLADSPRMHVEAAEAVVGRDGRLELVLVLPAQPTDDAVDSDMTRLCDKVMRGESTIFQVRFGMDLMEQCGARTPDERLQALSMYFAEAKRRVDEAILFGREAGRMASAETGEDEEDNDSDDGFWNGGEGMDRRRGGGRNGPR